MAYGSLLADVVQSSAVATPPQFNDTNGTQIGTLCRAWVCYNAAGSAIRSSFNVSSVTKGSAGFYTLNLTTALADTNYSTIVNAGSPNSSSYETSGIYTPSNNSYGAKTTSAVQVNCYTPATSNYDPYEVNVAIFR